MKIPVMATLEQEINNIKKTVENEAEEILNKTTSASANTLRSHLKKITVDEVVSEAIWSTFPNITSYEHYEEVKENQCSPSKLQMLKIRAHEIKERNFHLLRSIAAQYTEHKQLFKQAYNKGEKEYFNILEHKNLETISDKVGKIVYDAQVSKYAKSFVRSYKNLLNEDSLQLFAQIYDGQYDREYVSEQLRKIASFKSPEHLTQVLTNVVESEHSAEYIVHKIEKEQLNADIFHNEDNRLIVSVNDYEASQKLGSSQWCISTNEKMFDMYKTTASCKSYRDLEQEQEGDDEEYDVDYMNYHEPELVLSDYQVDAQIPSYQLFCYDFNRSPRHPEYMIGVTLSTGFELVAAHDRNDRDIGDEILKEHDNFKASGEKSYLEEIIEKVPFDKSNHYDEVMKKLKDYKLVEDAISSEWIVGQVRNPLNMLMESERQYNEIGVSLYKEVGNEANITHNLIRKSFQDLDVFNDISDQQMLADLMKAYEVTTIASRNKLDKRIVSHFDSDKTQCIEPKIFWRVPPVIDFVQQMDETQKNAFLTDYSQEFERFLEFYNETEYSEDAIKLSCANAPKSTYNRFVAVESIFMDEILESDKINDAYKAFIIFEKAKDKAVDFKMESKFLERVEDGTIHTANVLKNADLLNKNVLSNALDLINQDPESYLKPMDNHVIQQISQSELCLEKLTDKACSVLNQNIKNDPELFGNLQDTYSFAGDQSNFGVRMKALKDKGVIDDEIINKHYDSNKVSNKAKIYEDLFIQPSSKADNRPSFK